MSLRLLSTLAALSLLVIPAGSARHLGAQTGNLLSNGQFDDGIVPWPTTFSNYGFLTHDPGHDDNDCVESGAAAASADPSADFGSANFSVCVDPVIPEVDYLLAASFLFLDSLVDGYANVHPNFYSGADCTGEIISTSGFTAGNALSSVSGWQRFVDVEAPPAGTMSARIKIFLNSTNGASQGALEVLADEIVFAAPSYVFADNFEVSSSCRWSDEQP